MSKAWDWPMGLLQPGSKWVSPYWILSFHFYLCKLRYSYLYYIKQNRHLANEHTCSLSRLADDGLGPDSEGTISSGFFWGTFS